MMIEDGKEVEDGGDDVQLQTLEDGKMAVALYVCVTPSEKQTLSLWSEGVQSVVCRCGRSE